MQIPLSSLFFASHVKLIKHRMKEANIRLHAEKQRKGTYLAQYHQDLVELQGHGRRRGGRVAAEVLHPFFTARAKGSRC